MKLLVRTKQKKASGICGICTREDCPLFKTINVNRDYYQACEKEFMLHYNDDEEMVWCGACEQRASDHLCLECANKKMDFLLSDC